MQHIRLGRIRIQIGQLVYLKNESNMNGKTGPFILDTILIQPNMIECHFRLANIDNKESTFVVGFSKLDV